MLIPSDLLLPSEGEIPAGIEGDELTGPVVWAPVRSGRVADPGEDGVVVP